jgi:uncharacterized surface protein with fasciclin (FAS1) repeats
MKEEPLMLRRLISGVLLASLALAAIAPAVATAFGGKDIVERAIQLNSTRQLDTLLAAATCDYFGGDIADALATTPDITLLAPTDRAFTTLGLDAGNVCEAFAGDPAALADILTYHVIPDVVTFREATKAIGTAVPTLNGQDAEVSGRPGNVKIDGARVIVPNLPASNGLIHIVNAVLIP